MTSGDDRPPGLLISGRFAELEDALAERVLELKRGRPLEPLTVVVGSAAVRTYVQDLLVRRLGAVANLTVVTLAALAHESTTRARGAPPVVLGGVARERLVRRVVAARAASGLEYYGPVWARPHFARALRATFDDLREALVDPGSEWTVAVEAAPFAPPADAAATGAAVPADDLRARRAKAADLGALYAGYCDELGRLGVLDTAQVLREAAQAVADRPLPGRVLLYGLYDVNRAQEALVDALVRRGADLFVPVPRDGDDGLATTLAAGRRAGLRERRLAPPPAARALDRVAAVWSRPGQARERRLDLGADGTLAVVSVGDERGETREAARALLDAAARGAAFRDCAVLVPHGDDVERVAAALEAAGLPVACRRPDRGDGVRVLRRLVECLAPEAGRPFARRAVVDLLVAAPLRGAPPPRATALWLDEARRAGVVAGLDEWSERLELHVRDLRRRLRREGDAGEALVGDDEAERPSVLRLRSEAAQSLARAVADLGRASACLPPTASWEAWADGLAAFAEILFSAPVADAVRDAAGGLRALAALGEEVDAGDAVAALRELLARRAAPTGSIARDGVAVVTPLEARGLRFHDVLFTGLAEGGFPSRGRPDPILGDAERRRVADAFATRLPLAGQREAESALLFAFACEAARERLTLFCPRTEASTGRPRLPSRSLLHLAALAAGRPVSLARFLTGDPLRGVWRRTGATPRRDGGAEVTWVDVREFDTSALLAVSAGPGGRAREYLAGVLGDPAAAERRLGQWRAGRSPEAGPWDGLLGAPARAAFAALGARHPLAAELHPTRLERYVDCPFAFFLRDVLGLEAPEEPGDDLEIEPLELGRLAHGILERAVRRVIDEGLDRDAALAAVAAAWRERCAEAERRGVTGAPLAWEVRRDVLLDDLLEAVRRDPVFARVGERPVAVELRFGERHGAPVTLELAGGAEVRFAGRLDRLDETPAGARVVDYKTGGGATERARLRHGLSVQLPVYQLAVRRLAGAAYAEVTCLYRLVTRRGGFAELPLEGDEDAARARLSALVGEILALIDEGVFARTSQRGCDFCDVSYACGVSAWARGRKREHGRLAGLVRLQTVGPGEEVR